jgi:hypothetical protein
MAVSKHSRIYHCEFELGGRRYRGSTKRQDALKVEATKRTRLLNSLQEIPNPTAVPTFAEFADQFLKWTEANLALPSWSIGLTSTGSNNSFVVS